MNKPNKDVYYSLADLIRGDFLWRKDRKSIVKIIERDVQDKNVLKAIKDMATAQGKESTHGNRYFIKGKNIIKAVELWEQGKLFKKK